MVGATCLNSQHPVIARRRFDYCIVDEASQITLPICLGPLRNADVFVLVRLSVLQCLQSRLTFC